MEGEKNDWTCDILHTRVPRDGMGSAVGQAGEIKLTAILILKAVQEKREKKKLATAAAAAAVGWIKIRTPTGSLTMLKSASTTGFP